MMDGGPGADGGRIRKRRADTQDTHNERLSKRLSLLNLDRNAQKLYVPVENISHIPRDKPDDDVARNVIVPGKRATLASPIAEESMQIDDTAHKVYIYNLDDELSDSESSADEGKLSFPNHVKRYLLETRMPPSVRANKDGELAGHPMSNELVLYNVPSSLTVTEEHDSVRKAIIESRARTREKQRRDNEASRTADIVGLTSLSSGGGLRPFSHATLQSMPQPLEPASDMPDSDAMDLD